MTKHRALAFPILLLPIATFATAWVAAVPHQLQAGSNDLQRGLYGPASAEYFGPYLEEHGSARGKTFERQPSKDSIAGDTTTGIAAAAELSRALKDRSRYVRDDGDRRERNLDQIGGGNLLRRGLLERESAYDSGRWPTPMNARNLDQIGGGNLLRDVDDRLDRNLDQIGGGNLVRDLAQVANEIARERAVESRSRSSSHLPLPLQSRYADGP
ncbi:uncharacterized protein LOC143369856 isoform X1 [Andrena cerasifolii]|uniref:uncharacterized protein LOC143369856 isoform X1 n=1 Tax=Andrena cerasifolii TaxID=2819439 RepID=UPI004037EEFB